MENNNKSEESFKVIKCDEVTEEKIEWVIEWLIPCHSITLLAGVPGEGKSTIATKIMAAVSSGTPVTGEGKPNGHGAVCLYINNEDSPGTTIVPRLKASGANLENCILIDETEFTEIAETGAVKYVKRLKETVHEHKVKLLIIDPFLYNLPNEVGYTGKNANIVMKALVELAREEKCTIILIQHLNKQSPESSSDITMDDLQGGRVFSGVARSILLACPYKHDESIHALVLLKSNVAPINKGIAYTIEKDSIIWHEKFDPLKKSSVKNEVKAFILRLLSDKALNGTNFVAKRKENQISESTWDAAKRELVADGKIVYELKDNNYSGNNMWSLTDEYRSRVKKEKEKLSSFAEAANDGD